MYCLLEIEVSSRFCFGGDVMSFLPLGGFSGVNLEPVGGDFEFAKSLVEEDFLQLYKVMRMREKGERERGGERNKEREGGVTYVGVSGRVSGDNVLLLVVEVGVVTPVELDDNPA